MASEYAFHGTEEFTDGGDLLRFVPTLFIGLGGTGKDILMRFRKKLYDEYGMPNEKFVTFLVLDTDDQTDVPRDEKEEAFRPVLLRRNEGEFIKCTIEPTEWKGILGKMRDEHDRRYIDWLHPQVEQLIPPGALETGAGTYRQAGRVSFFRRYGKIRAQIAKHFRDMRAHAALHPTTVFGNHPGEVYDDRLEVVIITSLAGGTGSGTFIDVAYLVRDILDNDPEFNRLDSSHSTVIALMPTIFAKADPNLASRFRQNAYAALLEMEYYNTPRPDENPLRSGDGGSASRLSPLAHLHDDPHVAAGDTQMVEFYVNWDDPQTAEKPIRTHAWDTCYLIDDVNDRRSGAAQTPAGVYQMVADYLFLDFGASRFALAKRSARSNHVQLRDRIISARVYESPMLEEERQGPAEATVLFENKYGCTFSSFGLAEIFIDKDRIDRSAAYRMASRLILRRWLGDPNAYTENTYEQWTKDDLQGNKAPEGETEAISFHPDHMWREMLKGDKQDWLGLVKSQFENLDKLDPDQGAAALETALKKNDQELSKSAASDGLPGAARRTLDARLDELRGSASKSGKLRTRLAKLVRQRFNRVGALPTLELLKVYRRAFDRAAERAAKQKNETTLSNQDLLARLRDAQEVPFVCRRIAQRIEYKRACAAIREVVDKRYAIAAGEHLEKLANSLRDYVGKEEATPVRAATPSLVSQYGRIRDFLLELQAQLDRRFEELQHVPQADRNHPLVPNWNKQRYDEETDAVLLGLVAVGHKGDDHTVNWEKAEAEVLRELTEDEQGNRLSLAQLVESWQEACDREGDALADIAEQLARACRKVFGGVRLEQFANGNVVDYLTSRSKEERSVLLEKMVDAAAPYYPMIRDYKVAVPPAYRNLLGRNAGGPQRQKNAAAIAAEVNGISLKKGVDHRDAIHRQEEGPPTSLILVREMGGVPLHYYNRLKELEKEYHSDKNAQFRKTCHIKFRENFEDLPDIELIDGDLIRKIRENVHYVLWCFLLRTIHADNDGGFLIEVPDPVHGGKPYRLGARISRIIKHAVENDKVRHYLQRRWSKWREKATPKHLAVVYSAIKQTLELFPKVRHAHADTPDPPIFNCYKKLLAMTGEFLMETEEGRQWFKMLREGDPLDDDYEAWRKQYLEISKHIRETCLVKASADLPFYQIIEKRIPDVCLPGAELHGGGPTDGSPGGAHAPRFSPDAPMSERPFPAEVKGNGDAHARRLPFSDAE